MQSSVSRRSFLKKGGAGLAGAVLFSNKLFARPAHGEIVALQLYSVRDEMSKDPLGTLKQLAEFGYHFVEHASYQNRKFYGYSVPEFKQILGDLDMKMLSGHTSFNEKHWDASKKEFTDLWKHTVEDAAEIGQEFIISPALSLGWRKTYDDMLKYMDVFNKCGAYCKKWNTKFGYHNHDFEFSEQLNGKKIYDILLQNTDPDLVAQQIDIGNMYGAGGRAMDIIKQYPGRFELMHVKDEIKSASGSMEGYESAVLGTGVIGVKDVLHLAQQIGGTKHFVIEQESYQENTPLEAVKKDLEIMKSWGYH